MRIKEIKTQGSTLELPKARIIGRLMGDGSIYRSGSNYTIKYEVKDDFSLASFSRDLENTYGLEPSWGINKSGITGEPVSFVRLRSKKVYEDLMEYGPYSSREWRIPKEIFNGSLKVKGEFLKALFSDDGTVLADKREIKLYSTNLRGLREVDSILGFFNIKTRLHSGYGNGRNVYALVISGIEEMSKFLDGIGFCLPRKMSKLREIVLSQTQSF